MATGKYGPRHLVVAAWGTFVVCTLILPTSLLFALNEMGRVGPDVASLAIWGFVTGLSLLVGNIIFAAWFAAVRSREKKEAQPS